MQKHIINYILITIDIALFILLFYFSLFVRDNISFLPLPQFNYINIEDFSFVIIILFFLLYNEKIYTNRYDFWQETLKIIKSFVVGFILVLAILAITKMNLEYSRMFILIYFINILITFPIAKRLTKKILFSFFKKKVLILGEPSQVNLFKKEFNDNWYLGQTYAKDNYNSILIIAKNLSINDLNDLINKHFYTNRELYIVPYLTNINFAHSDIIEYYNIRHNAISIENKLLIKSNTIIKNIFDKTIMLFMLPFVIIIHLVISILIFSSSKNNIFFRQPRLGKNNNIFICYKYQTMYENSEKLLNNYLNNNPDEIKHYEKFHKYKNDPRVTKIGKFLRSTSLDELPQILNVIKGEMSFVGPRPYMLSESEKIKDKQEFILKVRPGITGLWQVGGKNKLTFKQRNDLEIWYIKNWSLWIDFVILMKTIKVVIFEK